MVDNDEQRICRFGLNPNEDRNGAGATNLVGNRDLETHTQHLLRIDIAALRSRILEASTIAELTQIRDMAEVVRATAKRKRTALDVPNLAAEIKLRAERKAGTMLAQLSLRGGDRKSKNRVSPQTLGDLGVSPDESKRWQKEASISEDEFEAFLKAHIEAKREITQASLLRYVSALNTYGREKNASQRNVKPTHKENTGDKQSSPFSALREIKNHFDIINGIGLKPLCQNRKHDIDATGQRLLMRYIQEISELFDQLLPEEQDTGSQ